VSSSFLALLRILILLLESVVSVSCERGSGYRFGTVGLLSSALVSASLTRCLPILPFFPGVYIDGVGETGLVLGGLIGEG
jgi:hypothetical protein